MGPDIRHPAGPEGLPYNLEDPGGAVARGVFIPTPSRDVTDSSMALNMAPVDPDPLVVEQLIARTVSVSLNTTSVDPSHPVQTRERPQWRPGGRIRPYEGLSEVDACPDAVDCRYRTDPPDPCRRAGYYLQWKNTHQAMVDLSLSRSDPTMALEGCAEDARTRVMVRLEIGDVVRINRLVLRVVNPEEVNREDFPYLTYADGGQLEDDPGDPIGSLRSLPFDPKT